MSGETNDRVSVVSDSVVATRGVLASVILGFDWMSECNLLPMPVSVGGALSRGSHSS